MRQNHLIRHCNLCTKTNDHDTIVEGLSHSRLLLLYGHCHFWKEAMLSESMLRYVLASISMKKTLLTIMEETLTSDNFALEPAPQCHGWIHLIGSGLTILYNIAVYRNISMNWDGLWVVVLSHFNIYNLLEIPLPFVWIYGKGALLENRSNLW